MQDDNNQTHQDFGPTSQFSTSYKSVTGQKKPRNYKKVLFIVFGAIGIFAIGAGGTIAYLLLNKDSDDSKSDTVLTLSELGGSLKSSLKTPNSSTLLTYQPNDPATVISKVAEKTWITTDDGSTVLTVGSSRQDKTAIEKDYDDMVSALKNNGLTEINVQSNTSTAYSADKNGAWYFASDYIVCNLRNVPNDDSYSVQADCAEMKSFEKNSDSVKTLATAYSGDKDTLFTRPSIQNASVEGYKNATLNISTLDKLSDISEARFYRTPDQKWHFFTSENEFNKLSCAEYGSDDLKNAFLGFTCWDTSTNMSSFVLKANPTFEIVPGSLGQ